MSGQHQNTGGTWQAGGQALPQGYAIEFGTGRRIPVAQASQTRVAKPVRRPGG